MANKCYSIRSSLNVKPPRRTIDEILKCTNFSIKQSEFIRVVVERLKNFDKVRNSLIKQSNDYYGFNCLQNLNTPYNMQLSELKSVFTDYLVQEAPVVLSDKFVSILLKKKKQLMHWEQGIVKDAKGNEHLVDNYFYGVKIQGKCYTFCVRHHAKLVEGEVAKTFNAGIYLLMSGKHYVELARYDNTCEKSHFNRFDSKGELTRSMTGIKKGHAHFHNYSEKQIVIFPYDLGHYDVESAAHYKTFESAKRYFENKWGLESFAQKQENTNLIVGSFFNNRLQKVDNHDDFIYNKEEVEL